MDYIKSATEQAANVMSMDSMPCTSAQAMLPVTTQNIAGASAAMLSTQAVQSNVILSAILGVFILATAAAYAVFARLETQEAHRMAALSGELHLPAAGLECRPLKCCQWQCLRGAAHACYGVDVQYLRITASPYFSHTHSSAQHARGPIDVPFPRHCECASQGTQRCQLVSGRAQHPCRSPCPRQKARLAERAGARRLRRLSRCSPPSRTGMAAGALMRCVLRSNRHCATQRI